jgi:toxin ParE1/3/4
MKDLRITPLDRKTVAAFVIDEKRNSVLVLNVFYGGRDYETIMMESSQKSSPKN